MPNVKANGIQIDFNIVTMQAIAGSGFPFDEQFIRSISARAYDRAFYPPGVGRQMMAVMAQENRTSALGSETTGPWPQVIEAIAGHIPGIFKF